ncbi:MAG TPA: flotillin family protein [Bacteroidetes bacterium]|nr:flotillin family protein [Bacteroidota bacterium]
MPTNIIIVGLIIFAVVFIGILAAIFSWYKKVPQGQALVRTGSGGTKVVFDKGMFVIPVLHMVERMDLSVKTIEIARTSKDGLICKDNIRADIKVVFFTRVNKEVKDITKVAQTIGTARASDIDTLRVLFEAKFSEALKTVGKRFDFVDLYDSREKFKHEILGIIGTDLNGYVLDDCAIDYLEQTPLEFLSENNILDAEGIKKITDLTAKQKVKSNFIRREEEKTIKEQNVEAREAILEYERQLAEKEERQKREVANIKAREEAEIAKINEEERLRSEIVRIRTDEELAIAEENKLRQVIVAAKNKERTEAVETERVEKERLLEATEKDKIVTLAEIAKEKAIELERKNIQDVIKERIMVEKKVVEEEERIKDTKELATAERARQVAVIKAEEIGQAAIIEKEKMAEAEKLAALIHAEKLVIDAEATMNAASKEAEARKINAEAKAAEEATLGLSEAQVIEAKAKAKEYEGSMEAIVIEKQAMAEAKGIEAKAEAIKKQGLAEADVAKERGAVDAKVLEQLAIAEAKGVEQKALAMQKLDGVGKDHEEFKLQLEKEKAIELAHINVQKEIAEAQASVLGEAFKTAKIDIVGGDMAFVDNIMNQINRGKGIDRMFDNSKHLADAKHALLGNGNANGGGLLTNVKNLIAKSGLSSEDVKNLSLTALLIKLHDSAKGKEEKGFLNNLMERVTEMGIGELGVKGLF